MSANLIARRAATPRRAWNWRTLSLLALLIIVNLTQVVSLLARVGDGTDFTVFYNTGRLLDGGAGGELYRGKDQTTGWLRTIPPFGQALIHPFERGSIQAAALGWSVFNLALLALTAGLLRAFAARLDAKSRVLGAVWPHGVTLLLALAPGCVQVGQFSILFVACWVGALALSATRFRAWSGAALALPIAVKVYPALLLAVPFLARRPRALAVALLFVALWSASPWLLYGARTGELTASFWQSAIASPQGRLAESQNAGPPFSQGLDSVALRYLTSNPRIARRFPGFRHLDWPRQNALRAVEIARLAVMMLSFGVGWRFWQSGRRAPLWGQAMLLALWCAALYVILPGAKSRYAIYAFPAFWPLLCCAWAARRLDRKPAFWAWSLVAVICYLALVQLVPSSFRIYGIGWLGALLLWGINLALLWRWSRRRPGRQRVRASFSPTYPLFTDLWAR